MSKQGLNMKFKEYDALLNECIAQRVLEGGQRVQAHVMKTHYLAPLYLRTRLIMLYVKYEVLSDARKVFDEMPERNVVAWTAMISEYSRSGFYSETLILLIEMLKSGTDPKEFIFSTVLASCTGSFEFECGRQIHSLTIKSPFESHGLKKIAGDRLLEIEPKNAGNYVVLCNLYARGGRWDDVKRLRELMKEKVVVKEPGKSWIEFGRTIHTFYASDLLNSRKDDVFYKVNDLSDMIKSAGYMPDLTSVLYDVDEE